MPERGSRTRRNGDFDLPGRPRAAGARRETQRGIPGSAPNSGQPASKKLSSEKCERGKKTPTTGGQPVAKLIRTAPAAPGTDEWAANQVQRLGNAANSVTRMDARRRAQFPRATAAIAPNTAIKVVI